MSAIESIFVWMNGLRNRMSSSRYPAGRVLLLLPHCLQKQGCKELVKDSIDNCKLCGRCKMKELRLMSERLGIKVHVAAGGREALASAKSPDISVIVAVACSKELSEGIRGAFPKRVIGVFNIWPHGPCKDTDVDVAKVETALRQIIQKDHEA